jgi:competence protein ComFB
MATSRDYDVYNVNEIVVSEAIEKYLEEHPDFCGCSACRLDLAAIALNSMVPRYQVGLLSDVREGSEEWESHFGDAKEAVEKAARKVAENPHHE